MLKKTINKFKCSHKKSNKTRFVERWSFATNNNNNTQSLSLRKKTSTKDNLGGN